jgi:hypothetical protein
MKRALTTAAIAAVAVSMAAATTGAQATTTPASSMRVGITDPGQEGTANYWTAMTNLNAQVTRIWVEWPKIAPSRPRNGSNPLDPAYRFKNLDATMMLAGQWAQKTGGRIMLTVWETPSWARRYRYIACYKYARRVCVNPNAATATYAEPVPASYAAFMVALAKRYNGQYTAPGQTTPLPRITALEVWNEPNARYFWAGKHVRNWAPQYVDVLNATYKAVHALPAPFPQVVGGAIGAYVGVNHLKWLESLIRYKALLDGISVHPYTHFPKWGVRDGTPGYKSSLAAFPYFRVGNFAAFVKIVDAAWGKKLPIWVTEIGIQSNPPDRALGVGQKAMINYLDQSVAALRKYPQVVAYMWYLLKDEPNLAGWQSGLYTNAGQVRTGLYNAFAAINGGVTLAAAH